TGGDIGTVRESDHQMACLLAQPGRRARAGDVGAELLGLDECSLREVAAAETGREAEVVLCARARTRLAANGHHLQPEGAQTFGCSVHRSGQAGRTAADHDEV